MRHAIVDEKSFTLKTINRKCNNGCIFVGKVVETFYYNNSKYINMSKMLSLYIISINKVYKKLVEKSLTCLCSGIVFQY